MRRLTHLPLRRRLLLASLGVACVLANPRVHVVVSTCKEAVEPIIDSVLIYLDRHAVPRTVSVYEKCGPLRGQHGYKTVRLDNVGRETYSYFHYIESAYDDLEEITVFINGGIASKQDGMHTLHELLKNVVTHDGRHNMSTFRYGDAGFSYHAGDALPTPKVFCLRCASSEY